MIRIVVRILIGVSGALALFMAARIWLDPATPAGQLGLQGIGPLGASTLRADLGGFFGAAGIFALAAALLNDARLALVPLALLGLALIGRCITAASLGFTPEMTMPMAVEAVLAVLYTAGWRVLGR